MKFTVTEIIGGYPHAIVKLASDPIPGSPAKDPECMLAIDMQPDLAERYKIKDELEIAMPWEKQ